MARRETRRSPEHSPAAPRRSRPLTREEVERHLAKMEEHLARMRAVLHPAELARMEMRFREGVRRIAVELERRKRRRPGDGSMPALVEPPRGPAPLAGGAAAPLEFDL